MTSEEQTKWKGFTIVYYYPKSREVVMSGVIPDEFSGKKTIKNVTDFQLYDLSKVKFVEMSSSFTRIVVKKDERFELEMKVKQMREMHYTTNKIVELR